MPKHQIGYTAINGHKHKPLHPLAVFVASILRDTLGVIILAVCILVPVFLAAFLQS